MKIALICDTHAGARSDSHAFHDHAKKFYDDVFFPVLEDEGITEIIHLGDIFDRRKFVNFYTLYRLRKDFINPIGEKGYHLTHILGNHDISYKNTLEVNSPNLLLGDLPFVEVIDKPLVKTYDQMTIGLVPWICDDNKKQISDFLRRTKANGIMGHFELEGFKFNKSTVAEHGMKTDVFSKFQFVYSGHYHHKSHAGNIHYLGNTIQMDWGDYGDLRGFSILDTETGELTFIPNPYDMFIKFFYNDDNQSMEQMLDFDASVYNSKFVKIVVEKKTNPQIYDLVFDKIEDASPLELTVVDEHLMVDLTEVININLSDDVVENMHQYVDELKVEINKDLVKQNLRELYDSVRSE